MCRYPEAGEQKEEYMRKPLFDRSQVGTPGHDALCAWLHDEIANLQPEQWPGFFRFEDLPQTGSVRWVCADQELHPQWEFSIDGGAGFADMAVIVPIQGVADGRVVRCLEWLFVFEVKTTITSVGDVLRQVNFYKDRLSRGYNRFDRKAFFVVCPSPKYQAIIESQGFHFIKAPEGIA